VFSGCCGWPPQLKTAMAMSNADALFSTKDIVRSIGLWCCTPSSWSSHESQSEAST
jgi:uncharacterized cupin superfamily protein